MSRTAGKPTISQLIANLPFVKTVDTMLLEGTSASQVAHFIQEDQGALEDVGHKTLTNALARRKKQRLHDLENEVDIEDDDGESWFDTGRIRDTRDDPGPAKPSVLARGAYKRTKGGIDEIIELEALYLTQRDRIDRLVDLEHRVGAFSDKAGNEIAIAVDTLMKRIVAKEKVGLLAGGKTKEVRDIEGYSKETAQVLSRPDSRRRVISIVERIKRMQEAKEAAEAEAAEDEESREVG